MGSLGMKFFREAQSVGTGSLWLREGIRWPGTPVLVFVRAMACRWARGWTQNHFGGVCASANVLQDYEI